jgi:transcriptional regulator with XRE-family HTH domain
MEIKEVIQRISQLRTKANLSARELSLRIGKNEAYITRLESKNTFEPSVSTLLDIITVCNSNELEFFYYDINQYKKDLEIINLLKTTTEKKKQAIIDLLKN